MENMPVMEVQATSIMGAITAEKEAIEIGVV
jgi:hypothetical protein